MSGTSLPGAAAGDASASERQDTVDGTALSLFRDRLARGGDRPMLHALGTTLSARDVDELSDRVARGLQERGVVPGDRVSLLLQNDPQFPVVQLGAWKVGAVSVPHNPMLTSGELERQLADAGSSVLVCLDELADAGVTAARQANVRHVALTGAHELLGGPPSTHAAGSEPLATWLSTRGAPALADPAPGDLAVITYTSGTTGPAKGVCSSHRNVAWAARAFAQLTALGDDTVILGSAPLFHVTGQVGHLALGDLLGAPLVLDHRFDAERQLAAAERHGATFLVAAVTAYHALMRARERAPTTLTTLVAGAQTVSPALLAAVERWSGRRLQNIYGMTETTSPAIGVPAGRRAPVAASTGALSIGLPVPGTDAAVLDPDTHEPLPPGEPGELAVRGPQVAGGYWNRPDADAAAFHDGWLLTGDLAVVDEDGWYFVVDRIKDLINAAGFKVAPHEVEDVICRSPDVREAAVVGEPDAYRGETVVAYVVAEPGRTVDAASLDEHCRAALASYKCPRRFEVVDELPRTASGKVVRRELRKRVVGGEPA